MKSFARLHGATGTGNLVVCVALLLISLSSATAAPVADAGANTNAGSKTVLLLHSYSPPMDWVRTITRAVENKLPPNSGEIDLRLEFMDTKRHYSPAYLAHFRDVLEVKYRDIGFDLIIASDNNAYDFLRRHRDDLFPGVPVVFCGVNGFDPTTLDELSEFTGVAEVYAPGETVELMLEMHPETREIFFINDYLTTGRQVHGTLANDLARFEDRVRFTFNDNVPLHELEERLHSLEPGQLVLLGVYYGDSVPRGSTFAKMGERLAAACPVPMYCLLDFNVTESIVGGRVTGAAVQGRAAARMAKEILNGADPNQVPIRPEGAFAWEFSYSALKKWNIDADRLPIGSVVLDEPPSFVDGHRGLVIGTLSIIVLLVGVILYLMANNERRRVAERALRRSEEYLSTTLTSIGDGVLTTDAEGHIVRINPAAQEITGWTRKEAQGRHLTEVFRLKAAEKAPPGPPVDLSFETVLRSGEPVTIAAGTILVTRDGSERLIADSGAPIRSGDGETRGVVIVFRDVTEQMTLERRLSQSQKMESVGQLAGGIAHDFNNMLAGIIGYAEILQLDLQNDPEALDSIGHILYAGERASALTRKLLDFSRKGKTLSTPLDLHDVIEDALSLLRRTVGQSVDLEVSLDARQRTIVGDPTQLQQVVMNLCINARDAMPDGGTISLVTRDVDLNREYCDQSPFDLEPGPHVRLTVADTGAGIPEAVRDRIFEPFYTTKEPGRGTGLGLAAVYGCVETHGGSIRVDSEENIGTIFSIDLPLRDVEVESVAEPIEIVAGTVEGTILVIDDDDTVRGMAIDLLASLGYKVRSARDGNEGLEKFYEHKNEIDVVLLDLVMPGLSGRPTFHGIRRIDPEACVVLTSGFADPEAVSDLLESGLCGFVGKPYRRSELLAAMETARAKRNAAREQ